jgi:hypothetical protein
MTLSKKVYRNRKPKAGEVVIPKWIRKWFAKEIDFTFHAYTHPFTRYIDQYWSAWVELHPEAKIEDYKNLNLLVESAPKHREFIEKNKEFRGKK